MRQYVGEGEREKDRQFHVITKNNKHKMNELKEVKKRVSRINHLTTAMGILLRPQENDKAELRKDMDCIKLLHEEMTTEMQRLRDALASS